MRQTARWLEGQLIFVALIAGCVLVVASFSKRIAGRFPESAVQLVRQLAVGLVVAGFAAVVLPRLLKRDELKNILIDFVRTDVLDTIKRATASLEAIQSVGISCVYASRADANADMMHDLDQPSREIRVLGLSLDDMIDYHGPLRQTWMRFRQLVAGDGRPIPDVKVLLIDPNSLGAALRSQGEGDSGDTSTLARDVEQSLAELASLANEHAAAGGTSFDFRLYRVAPQLFFCLTDSVAYLQPYYFQRPAKDRGDQPPLPLLRCEGEDLLADLRNHFDLIWQFASTSADEYRRGHAVGTDRGTASSAVVNVFSSPETAARRMKWVIRETTKQTFADAAARPNPMAGRLWLQGNSLDSYFRGGQSELYEAVLEVVERGADVRVLLLHPYCTQAHFRSYREYLIARPTKPMKFSEYYGSGKHERSTLAKDTTQTIEQILELKESYANIAVQLYATAPFCFLLLTDERAMVEQYHFGRHPRGQSRAETQILGKDMPIVEYTREAGGPLAWRNRSPYSLLESHFIFVWERDVADNATEADLDPESGRARASELERSPLGSVSS